MIMSKKRLFNDNKNQISYTEHCCMFEHCNGRATVMNKCMSAAFEFLLLFLLFFFYKDISLVLETYSVCGQTTDYTGLTPFRLAGGNPIFVSGKTWFLKNIK